MTARRALISGASIVGPVLAFWLSEAGWDVTIVERAERLRTSGYPVDVRGTAIDVVRRMGLPDQISAERYRHVPVDLLAPEMIESHPDLLERELIKQQQMVDEFTSALREAESRPIHRRPRRSRWRPIVPIGLPVVAGHRSRH